jgi:hypothetical protein
MRLCTPFQRSFDLQLIDGNSSGSLGIKKESAGGRAADLGVKIGCSPPRPIVI